MLLIFITIIIVIVCAQNCEEKITIQVKGPESGACVNLWRQIDKIFVFALPTQTLVFFIFYIAIGNKGITKMTSTTKTSTNSPTTVEAAKDWRIYVSSQQEKTVAVVDLSKDGKFTARKELDLNVGEATRAMSFYKPDKTLFVGGVRLCV
jgi:hypothetical protein